MPKSNVILRISGVVAALLFIAFTIWLIHEANIARDNILFKTVRATPYGDKIGHALLAGFLTLVVNFLIRNRCFKLGPLPIPYGSAVVTLVVIVEEASQYYLPTRSLEALDAVANFAGIILASVPAIVLWKRRSRVAQGQ